MHELLKLSFKLTFIASEKEEYSTYAEYFYGGIKAILMRLFNGLC